MDSSTFKKLLTEYKTYLEPEILIGILKLSDINNKEFEKQILNNNIDEKLFSLIDTRIITEIINYITSLVYLHVGDEVVRKFGLDNNQIREFIYNKKLNRLFKTLPDNIIVNHFFEIVLTKYTQEKEVWLSIPLFQYKIKELGQIDRVINSLYISEKGIVTSHNLPQWDAKRIVKSLTYLFKILIEITSLSIGFQRALELATEVIKPYIFLIENTNIEKVIKNNLPGGVYNESIYPLRGIENLISDGIPVESVILIECSHRNETELSGFEVVKDGLLKYENIIFVSSEFDENDFQKKLKALNIDINKEIKRKRIKFVDWYSYKHKDIRGIEHHDDVIRVSGDLSDLESALTEILTESGKHNIRTRIIIDIFSTIFFRYGKNIVYDFVRVLLSRFHHKISITLLIDKSHCSEDCISLLRELCDGIIEIKRIQIGKKIDREIMVKKLSERVFSSVPKKIYITHSGLKIIKEEFDREESLKLYKEIEGVGDVRAKTLIEHGYFTFDDLKDAGYEELSKIPKIGEKVAGKIQLYLDELYEQKTRKRHEEQKLIEEMMQHLNEKNYTFIDEIYSKLDNKMRESAEIQYILGMRNYEEKNYLDALDFFNNASTKKKDISYYIAIARTQKALGNFTGAIEWYKEALEFDRDNTELLVELGDTQINDERYKDAIISFKKVLAKSPDNIEVKYRLYQAYLQEKEYRLCKQIIEELIKQRPDNGQYWLDAAYANYLNNDLEKTYQYINSALIRDFRLINSVKRELINFYNDGNLNLFLRVLVLLTQYRVLKFEELMVYLDTLIADKIKIGIEVILELLGKYYSNNARDLLDYAKELYVTHVTEYAKMIFEKLLVIDPRLFSDVPEEFRKELIQCDNCRAISYITTEICPFCDSNLQEQLILHAQPEYIYIPETEITLPSEIDILIERLEEELVEKIICRKCSAVYPITFELCPICREPQKIISEKIIPEEIISEKPKIYYICEICNGSVSEENFECLFCGAIYTEPDMKTYLNKITEFIVPDKTQSEKLAIPPITEHKSDEQLCPVCSMPKYEKECNYCGLHI